MEAEATTRLITDLPFKKMLAKYEQSVKHIAVLIVQKNYEAAIVRGDKLIQTIALDITSTKDKSVSKLCTLLNDCLSVNKKNYQLCFNHALQVFTQQFNSTQRLNSYFKDKLMQAKTAVSEKKYLSAICICEALKRWLTEVLQVREKYHIVYEKLSAQCDGIYESIYFNWLLLDEIQFVNYHYLDIKSREEVLGHINELKKYTTLQDYQSCLIICTNIIQKLDSLSSQAVKISPALTAAWHKVVVFRRQHNAFTWLLNDYSTVSKQATVVNTLYQDLSLLARVSYFSELSHLEFRCKLGLFKLLFQPNVGQEVLKQLRDQFCSAFDAFNAQNENNNIALSLLGLGLINAYEGDKQAMLTGFKLATDYNANSKVLTQLFIQRLPFHMFPVAEILLPNPFVQSASSETLPYLKLNP